MSIFDGMFTGLVIGFLFSIPAFISESVRHGKNLPILMDVKTFWGKNISAEGVLLWSVFTHLLIASLFGGLYPFLVSVGMFPSYGFSHVVTYALGYYLVFGGLFAPLLGLGFFGRREGAMVWLELLMAHGLYAVSFWYAATRLFVL